MNHFLSQSQVARFMVIALGCIAIVAAMYAASAFLNPIFIAILFAVILDIPRSSMVKRGMSQGKALLVTILGTLLLVVIATIFLGISFINLTASLPEYQEEIETQLEELTTMLNQAGIQVDDLATVAEDDQTNPLNVITYVLGGIVSLIGAAVLILVYSIFLLIEVSGFPDKLKAAFNPTEPAYKYTVSVTNSLRNFLVAQTKVSTATGVGVTASLLLLDVQFAVLWGILAFFMNFIPYIGSILAAIPAVIVAFIQYGPSMTVVWVIVAYLLINVVVNYTIYPRVMSQGVDLSMFIVMAGMMFWGWILGPIGLILSVPISAVLKISLEAYPGSRWLAVMLGSGPKKEAPPEEEPATA